MAALLILRVSAMAETALEEKHRVTKAAVGDFASPTFARQNNDGSPAVLQTIRLPLLRRQESLRCVPLQDDTQVLRARVSRREEIPDGDPFSIALDTFHHGPRIPGFPTGWQFFAKVSDAAPSWKKRPRGKWQSTCFLPLGIDTRFAFAIRSLSFVVGGPVRCSGESRLGVLLSRRSCLIRIPSRPTRKNGKNLHGRTVKLGGSDDVKQFSQQLVP
jgi:hypothetical protein